MWKPYSRSNSRSDSRNWLDAKISARILGAFFSKLGRAPENLHSGGLFVCVCVFFLFHFFALRSWRPSKEVPKPQPTKMFRKVPARNGVPRNVPKKCSELRAYVEVAKVGADFWEVDLDSNFSIFRVRRFTEWPGPLHWIAFPIEILTKPLIHWIPSPLFTENPFFCHWKVLRRIPCPKIGSEKETGPRALFSALSLAPGTFWSTLFSTFPGWGFGTSLL